MKNKLLFIFIILLLPKIVNAEELPTEGVHYFMGFPNNEEIVTKDYNETGERLIYTGKTNENGEIILSGWKENGQLRIVQKVPSGYSTDQKEIIVDLSDKKANFIDYRGLKNPSTGQSLLLTIIALGVITGVILTVKTKDNKKYLLIIPVITLLCLNVKADNNEFIISVKDKQGNSIKDVEVLVYAKPTNIEASPAIEFNANGGVFIYDTEVLYLKIPRNNMTEEEIDNYIEELLDNDNIDDSNLKTLIGIEYATREGYRLLEDDSSVSYPEIYNNDTVINMEWQEDPTAEILTFHGNGGLIEVEGLKVTDLKSYVDISSAGLLIHASYKIKKEGYYNIGFDLDNSCSNYNKYGISLIDEDDLETKNEFYACWHTNPDGIYINNSYRFSGNSESCYKDYLIDIDKHQFEKGIEDASLTINTNDNSIKYCYINNPLGVIIAIKHPSGSGGQVGIPITCNTQINALKIVEKGNTILTLNSDDFGIQNQKTIINNTTELYNYLSSLDKCIEHSAPSE